MIKKPIEMIQNISDTVWKFVKIPINDITKIVIKMKLIEENIHQLRFQKLEREVNLMQDGNLKIAWTTY